MLVAETPLIQVLLVEDNPTDALLTREALSACCKPNNVTHLADGSLVMPFLLKNGPYRDGVRPDMILLDLNTPGARGHDVLSDIKSNIDLRSIPICIVTASKSESDIQRCYELRANSFITKPLDYDDYEAAIKTLCEFWFETATLPRLHAN